MSRRFCNLGSGVTHGVFAQISNKMHMGCLPSCAFLFDANVKK